MPALLLFHLSELDWLTGIEQAQSWQNDWTSNRQPGAGGDLPFK